MSRRDALIGLGAGFAALTLPGGGANAQQIRRGGTLNMILEADNKSLDPLFGSSGVDRRTFNLFAESLLIQPQYGKFDPWLAESYEMQDGGKTVIFRLRKDVKFQDGEPFNAAAAKFNLDRLIDPNLKPYPRQYTREVKSTDVIDDYTIRVNLSSPSVLFLPMMAAEAGAMMSPKAIREKGQDFLRFPVGTGPFKVVSRGSGEVVTVRNDNYWQMGADGKPLPYLDGIRMTVNGNTAVRLLQMQSGAAQLSDPVSVKDFDTVERDANLKMLDSQVGGAYVLSFNLDRLASKPDLRKAISHGLDRKAMVALVSQGKGTVLSGVEPPFSWAFDPTLKGHEFNPDLAREEYKRSGHSGPITLSISQRDDDIQVAEMAQQMMKEIGINLKIEVLERLAYAEKIQVKRDFDLGLSRSPLQRPDIHTQYAFSYSRVATTNYCGMKDEDIYNLVDQALGEFDQQKRKAIYVKIQQMILDNYYQTFLFWNPRADVASKKLNGIVFDATNIWMFDKLSLSA
jgi:peptide/nickel transport system substrate-binding protein